MSKTNKEHIKSLINKESIDKAPVDFTNKVMQDVFMSTQEEILKDTTLSSLLKRTSIEEPSHDFVSNIITQINTEKQIDYQPLISKKAWIVIFSITVVFLLFTFLNEAPKESSATITKVSQYLDQAQYTFTNPFKSITFSPLLTISLLCLSSMLLFDAVLKRKTFS